VPRLCEFYPGICFTIEEKAWKNLSQGKKNLSQVKKNLSHCTKTSVTVQKPQSQYKNLSHSTKTSVIVQYTYYQKHPHITKPSQTHTLQNPLIHTLQNNIKPPQYKLKRNAYRKSKKWFTNKMFFELRNCSWNTQHRWYRSPSLGKSEC